MTTTITASVTRITRTAPVSARAAARRHIAAVTSGMLALAAITLLAVPAAYAQCTVPCTLVWADEFDGSAVDESKWEFQIGIGPVPGWGNNELQYYRRENASVAGGELTITAKQEVFEGQQYTSARLRTLGLGDFTYGRFEMRARLPYSPPDLSGSTTNGLWPAFWLQHSDPVYGAGAASGEIDVMEWVGKAVSEIRGTLHYGGADTVFSRDDSSLKILPPGTEGDYHVYAIEWDENEIRWYFDGELYGVKEANQWFSGGPSPTPLNPPPAPFDIDFHMLLNLAVGGDLPGPPDGNTIFPAEYVIDYVRVYELPPAGPAEVKFVVEDMNEVSGDAVSSGDACNDNSQPFGQSASACIPFNVATVTRSTDVPPENGGGLSLRYTESFAGLQSGLFLPRLVDLTPYESFSFWINPDPGTYSLVLVLRDDDTGEGSFTASADDEFSFACEIGPAGPCATSGGGWQLVTIPLTDFTDNNSGGNGVLDAASTSAGGNGELLAVILVPFGPDVATFNIDYLVFRGAALLDPGAELVPLPVPALVLFALGLIGAASVTARTRRSAGRR